LDIFQKRKSGARNCAPLEGFAGLAGNDYPTPSA
jgi:hypothetical protein